MCPVLFLYVKALDLHVEGLNSTIDWVIPFLKCSLWKSGLNFYLYVAGKRQLQEIFYVRMKETTGVFRGT